jgi:hypothetical protein
MDKLSKQDHELIRQCLRAAVEGPFFPDWEFHILFGLDRSEVKAILDSQPQIDLTEHSAIVAVNNTLNHLLGYPHGCEDIWSQYISGSSEDVAALLLKLRLAWEEDAKADKQKWDGEVTYFDLLM